MPQENSVSSEALSFHLHRSARCQRGRHCRPSSPGKCNRDPRTCSAPGSPASSPPASGSRTCPAAGSWAARARALSARGCARRPGRRGSPWSRWGSASASDCPLFFSSSGGRPPKCRSSAGWPRGGRQRRLQSRPTSSGQEPSSSSLSSNRRNP
uniref:Uncharacterized protein n=1 Tax=Arundo donax TaxID=35708 RepID=A0A0A9DR63_ARUDO